MTAVHDAGPLQRWGELASGLGWLLAAILAHLTALLLVPHRSSAPRSAIVDVSAVDWQQPPPDPEPMREAPVSIPPPAEQPHATRAPRRPTPPDEEPPAPAEEAPLEFANIVLTNTDQSGDFAIEPGSGQPSDAPLASPDALASGRQRDGVAGGVIDGAGSALVSLGDLARAPQPPALKRKLERNYPEQARVEGREGRVRVRLTVLANGQAAQMRVLSESPQGYEFANACLKTLRGETWQPPLDAEGRRVSTIVTYECGFSVRR